MKEKTFENNPLYKFPTDICNISSFSHPFLVDRMLLQKLNSKSKQDFLVISYSFV